MTYMPRQKGFTLVEIQVAIVIFLLISISLSGTMYMSARVQNQSDKIINSNNEIRILSTFLRQQFSSFMPLKLLHEKKNQPLFVGHKNEVYFISQLSTHSLNGSPWLVHIFNKKDKLQIEFKSLVEGVKNPDLIKTTGWKVSKPIADIASVTFQYYHPVIQEWQSKWRDETLFPSHISIEIQTISETWPTIVIALNSNDAIDLPNYLLNSKPSEK